jgi:hypothetical protein
MVLISPKLIPLTLRRFTMYKKKKVEIKKEAKNKLELALEWMDEVHRKHKTGELYRKEEK